MWNNAQKFILQKGGLSTFDILKTYFRKNKKLIFSIYKNAYIPPLNTDSPESGVNCFQSGICVIIGFVLPCKVVVQGSSIK